MSTISKPQKRALATALRKQGLFDDRADIYTEFTGRSITSTGQLTRAEADGLLRNLNPTKTGQPDWKPGQKMRRAIISAAKEMNWTHRNGSIDMPRLNGWLVKYGMYHKKLNHLTPKELMQTLTQIRKVRDTYLVKPQ